MKGTVGFMICAGAMVLALAAAADPKGKKLDLFWTSPEMAHISLRSVALLPAASFDNDYKVEKEIEVGWGPPAHTTAYRWYYSTTSKDLLRRAFGGDSVLTAVRNGLLKNARVDSLTARALCAALHTSAVFAIRVDHWQQIEMEWNQTGKPSTTVELKAALVDSTGRLLWTAEGSNTGEGPMHNADSGTLGVKSSGLGTEPVTGQGGAPAFQEVLAPLFTRWMASFPGRPASPAPAVPQPPPGTPGTPGGN
jgi:hypothetical protein